MFKNTKELDRLVDYLGQLKPSHDISLAVQEVNNWNLETMTNEDVFAFSRQVTDLYKEIIKLARNNDLVETDMLFVLQGVLICSEAFIDFAFLNDRGAVHGAFEFTKNVVPGLKSLLDPESKTTAQAILDKYNALEQVIMIKTKLDPEVLARNNWAEMKLVNILDVIKNNDDTKVIIQKIDHLNDLAMQEMPIL